MNCRVCECSEEDACMFGCDWAEPDLCTTCAQIIIALCDYFEVSGPAKMRRKNLAFFDRLTAEAKRLLKIESSETAQPEPLITIVRA